MSKNKVIVGLEDEEENWYLSLVGASATLSFGGAVREATQTHPSFRRCQERRESDPIYAKRYELLVRRGRAIRKANKRRQTGEESKYGG